MLNCPDCKAEMVYGGDQETTDADERPLIVSNHFCHNCETEVVISRLLQYAD